MDYSDLHRRYREAYDAALRQRAERDGVTWHLPIDASQDVLREGSTLGNEVSAAYQLYGIDALIAIVGTEPQP